MDHVRLRAAAADALGDDPKIKRWFGAGVKGRLLATLFGLALVISLLAPPAGIVVLALTVGVWTVAEALH